MTLQDQKKRPIKLEWQGGLLNNTSESPVRIKNDELILAKNILPPKKIGGSVSIRIEKKGRGGNPVSILFKFTDPEARNLASLKQLCSELKTKLACGGTVENDEIILIIKDIEKLKNVLQLHFSLKC